MFFKHPLLAIDIGTSAVKVLETSGKNFTQLKTAGVELLPEGAVQGGMIVDSATVERAIKNLIKRLKIATSGRRAALSLGGGSVIIKRANFPNTNDPGELSETVFYEAEQHFQHDVADLYFDFHKLAGDPNNAEASVVLVGAKREIVEQLMATVKAAGLKIGLVDCDAFALTNIFEHTYGRLQGLVGVANVGASMTQISLLYNGDYIFARDVPIGGDTYTRTIASNLGVAWENAESLKIAACMGDNSQPEVGTVLTDTNAQLANDIQMTLDFFFKSGEAPLDATALSGLFLGGGASRTLGLGSSLAATLQTQVEVMNPFAKLVLPKKADPEQILVQSHLHGVSAGLGLRAGETPNS